MSTSRQATTGTSWPTRMIAANTASPTSAAEADPGVPNWKGQDTLRIECRASTSQVAKHPSKSPPETPLWFHCGSLAVPDSTSTSFSFTPVGSPLRDVTYFVTSVAPTLVGRANRENITA
jgi:hypothetical protein